MFIASRNYLSITHLLTADYFGHQCMLLEEKLERPEINIAGIEFEDQNHIAHRAFVTGTIFSAISFLEATINEIFQDFDEEIARYITGFDQERIHEMRQYWTSNKLKAKTLDKYQQLLQIAQCEQFDKGTNPYQDINNLIVLRNYLTHYKPEWIRRNEVHKVEIMFKHKFEISKLAHESELFFPDKILGAPFACWTVKRCVEFTDQFFKKLNVDPAYKFIGGKLNCV